MTDSDKTPEQLLAENQDLRRRLDESERRARALVEHSWDSVALLDGNGNLLSARPTVAGILDHPPEEIVGRSAFALVHPDDQAMAAERFDRLRQTEHARQTICCRCRHYDGSWRWLEFSAVNLLHEPGVWAIVCNYRDVTARVQAEEALRASEERYRLLFERNVAGVFRSTPDGRLLDCNDAFVRILGYESRAEMLAVPTWNYYFSREERTAIVERLRRERVLSNHELRMRRKDGRPAWVLDNMSMLEQPDGTPVFEGTVIDITERKRREEQDRQSQKMEAIGRLAGGVAHDFNNLLTVITGYSELLLSRVPAGDPAREPLQEVHKAGRRAAELTQQLLAFGRKQMLTPEILDLNAIVTELNKMLQRLIGEQIDVRADLDPALGPIRADRGQIEQVVVNLAVNARDSMPQGGLLSLTTRNVELSGAPGDELPPGSYVLLSIRDTGCGMDEATKAHIFEPFFTTKEVGKGTGLGLATVYGIIMQSGGYVEVDSQPHRGSTFRLYLPRVEGEAATGSSDADLKVPAGTETVLVAEDEEGVRELVKRTLQSHGYRVLAANDGREALTLADSFPAPIDLLVTDVGMPRMNGCQLADCLAGSRPGLRVLYLSGYTDDALFRQGVLDFPGEFLQKPFSPAMLARKVRAVLDLPARAPTGFSGRTG